MDSRLRCRRYLYRATVNEKVVGSRILVMEGSSWLCCFRARSASATVYRLGKISHLSFSHTLRRLMW